MTLQKKAAQLRIDIIEELYKAQSGHPGGSLSCIDELVALYYNVMNVDPADPQMPDRDRFVLSKGHCCPALYAVLADKGFFPKDYDEQKHPLEPPFFEPPLKRPAAGN